jgi:SAM-dependent methyltransferase
VTDPEPDFDPGDATLLAYRSSAALYIRRSRRTAPSVSAYLDRFARMVGPGPVLELGSGPGWEADYLEGRGVTVLRSDASPEFVGLLRAAGHDVLTIDVRRDDLGGPHPGIVADAVLLHLTRAQFEAALGRCLSAVIPGGVLGLTLKEGDGSAWTTEKIDQPRFFTYWREPELRLVMERVGWEVVELEHTADEPSWLLVIARRPNGNVLA